MNLLTATEGVRVVAKLRMCKAKKHASYAKNHISQNV